MRQRPGALGDDVALLAERRGAGGEGEDRLAHKLRGRRERAFELGCVQAGGEVALGQRAQRLADLLDQPSRRLRRCGGLRLGFAEAPRRFGRGLSRAAALGLRRAGERRRDALQGQREAAVDDDEPAAKRRQRAEAQGQGGGNPTRRPPPPSAPARRARKSPQAWRGVNG